MRGAFKSRRYGSPEAVRSRQSRSKYHLYDAERVRADLRVEALRLSHAAWSHRNRSIRYGATGDHSRTSIAQRPSPDCKAVPGSGLGTNYITPEFAGKDSGAQRRDQPGHRRCRDGRRTFRSSTFRRSSTDLRAAIRPNPYFRASGIDQSGRFAARWDTCTDILSFDGLHPSNTGYALIAYDFIETINKAYGTHIPEVDVKAVYDGYALHEPEVLLPRSLRTA